MAPACVPALRNLETVQARPVQAAIVAVLVETMFEYDPCWVLMA